ncbi:MAG: QacE family quaternary ammonium compound efflux SMR transporter [Gammaproteobacteria bacterium]|jgi:small multidrug resistance pump|nr:QacE family quaternary ammonium compound efflux SMR transporter [Gammaproteobacteria bacterium]MBE00927.1 QacE family quaternary ammonium compound efflux SMR transporter [Gammaproteobacteria bacterium]OUV75404.1 MAG: QacE family quaternary ammonium compound efflux SMR transporter [Gammaproteobacteria bacterium TMED139]
MKNWLILFIAILSETIATTALKASEGFTVLLPSIIVVIGYCLSFYFLSLTLRTIPVGIAYAVWSGVGVALVTLFGVLVYNQRLDFSALVGISLIMLGVVVLFSFSDSISQ